MEAAYDHRLSPPRVHQPAGLQEAWELKRTYGDQAVYVSGGTLIRTWWEAGTAAVPPHLIDLRGIAGMEGISAEEGFISVGALTRLEDCRRSGELQRHYPALAEAARGIAAPPVRGLATLGGNIASGYGDILPALLALDAEIAVFAGNFLTVKPLEAWLDERWSGGGEPAAALVAGIRLPKADAQPAEHRLSLFRKVGRREAFTASLATAAAAARLEPGTRRFRGVRLAAGGGSGRPQRLRAAEALLEGAACDAALLSPVFEAILGEFATYGDPFASEAYKKNTAANLLVSELWKFMQA